MQSGVRAKPALFAALFLFAASPGAESLDYSLAAAGLPASNVGHDCSTFNPGGWTGVAAGDLDGDGDDDLAAMGRLLSGTHAWLSDGAGSWTEHSGGLDPDCHGRSDIDIADWSGDGRPDLGTIGGINGAPITFRNEGLGWTLMVGGLAAGNGEGFSFGDWDGDGRADIGSCGHFSGGVHAWLGDGAGNWLESSAGLVPANSGGHRVTRGDFDGDGRDELVVTQFGTFDPAIDGVFVWSYDAIAALWSLRASWYFDQPYGVAAGDMSGDGLDDLVVATAQDVIGSRGGLHVFHSQGDGRTFIEASTGLPSQAAYFGDMAIGDLDNDGDLDIVAGDWGGVLGAWLNLGASGWIDASATGLPRGGDKVEGVAVGDFDADCRLDIAIAGYRDGVRAWRRSDPAACPILPEAGPARTICAGDSTTLDASSSRACGCAPGDRRYRWWDGAVLIQNWAPTQTLVVAPGASTSYRVDVACAADLGCFVSDQVMVIVKPGPTPPALANVLYLVKELPAGVGFAWTDLAGSWGDYQLLSLPAALGPPSQANFDGPLPVQVASAPPGAERASRSDALSVPAGLVFFRVRGTSLCGGAPGPA